MKNIFWLSFWLSFLFGCGNSPYQREGSSAETSYYEIFEDMRNVFTNQKLEVTVLPQNQTEGISVTVFVDIPKEMKAVYPQEFICIASRLIQEWETFQTEKMLESKQFNVIQKSGTQGQTPYFQAHFLAQDRNEVFEYMFLKTMGLFRQPQSMNRVLKHLSIETRKTLTLENTPSNIKKIHGAAVFALGKRQVQTLKYQYKIRLVRKFFADMLVFGKVKVFISGNIKKNDASVKQFINQLSQPLLNIQEPPIFGTTIFSFQNQYLKQQLIFKKKKGASFLFQHKIKIDNPFDMLKWDILCRAIEEPKTGLLVRFFKENGLPVSEVSAEISQNKESHFMVITADTKHNRLNETLFYYRKFINALRTGGITEQELQKAKNLRILAFDKSFIHPQKLGLALADYLLFENGTPFLQNIFSSLKEIKKSDLNSLTELLSAESMKQIVIADTTQIPKTILWD